MRPNLEKTHRKKELVEWLKVQTLSSNPSTAKKKKKGKGKHSCSVGSYTSWASGTHTYETLLFDLSALTALDG
jgi:hypothetical protein